MSKAMQSAAPPSETRPAESQPPTARSGLTINRRHLLTAGGAAVAVAATGVSLASEHAAAPALPAGPHRGLAGAAYQCVRRGKACLEHSLESMRSGDASLAAPAARVQELVLSCGALSRLAVNGSPQLSAMAVAVREIAAESAHAGHDRSHSHESWSALARSCDALVEQCDALHRA